MSLFTEGKDSSRCSKGIQKNHMFKSVKRCYGIYHFHHHVHRYTILYYTSTIFIHS